MAMLTDGDISQVQRIREVADLFTLARAEENSFGTMIRKGSKPKSSLYEAPFKIRYTPTDNAVLDGQDVSNSDLLNNEANKSMLQGRLQKGRVAIGVSDMAQEFGDEYAAHDLMADNMSDGLVLARESLEVTLLKNGDSNGQGDPTAPTPAARLRGMTNWIRSANPVPADLPVPTPALCPAGNILQVASASSVSDTNFNDIMKSIVSAAYMKGTWDVFVSPDMMQQIDSYGNVGTISGATVPLRRFNKDMADTKITMQVRFYQTSFGLLRFHLHFNLPTIDNGSSVNVHALIVNMDHVMLRPGYPVRTRELPYLGGGYRRIIEWVMGLDVNNPRAHGKITT